MTPIDDLDEVLARLAQSLAVVGCDVQLAEVTDPRPIDVDRALMVALTEPVGAPPLPHVARGARSVVIIISDATRAVPDRELLPAVVAHLNVAGVADERIDVVVGTGAHRDATPDELADMLGPEWLSRLHVRNHDVRGRDLVSVGRTPRGNEVLVDRRVAEADLRLALGKVEPHEFAGFTGGPKAILPAVAGYETIVRNHSIELMSQALARPGVLADNPIHEEFAAAARLVGLTFAVNVVLDRRSRVVALAAGDPIAAQAKLAGFVRAKARVELPDEPPDVIVTGPGRPLDLNLYQSIKPLVALEPVVDRRTTVVLVSPCRDGAGTSEMFEPFDGASSPEDVLARLHDGYTIEKDHAYFIARFLSRCPTVLACCPGVADELLRRVRFEPVADVEQAMRRALRKSRARRPRPVVLLAPRPQRALLGQPDGRSMT